MPKLKTHSGAKKRFSLTKSGKVKSALKFLSDGNRVKVSVRFRGREMAHTDIGEKLLMDFADACAEAATMEKNPKLEGRFMAMFLTPKNSK